MSSFRPEIVQEQVYVFKVYDGTEYTIFVDVMRKYCEFHKLPLRKCTIPQHVIDKILRDGTVDEWKLKKTFALDETPGIIIEFPFNEGHAIVDGNHRAVKKAQAGIDTMMCWVFPSGTWEAFATTSKDPMECIMHGVRLRELAREWE